MTKEENETRSQSIPGGQGPSFQPSQQQPRIPGSSYGAGGFAGSNQAAIYGAPATRTAQGRRLVIGSGITLAGEIEACDYLIVEGTVEAALKGASVLEIAETGTFYGTVEIDEATVAGRFEGEITVNGRLTITSTGSVTGTISYKELAVDAGATLDGKVSPSTKSAAAQGQKKDGKSAKGIRPRNDNEGDGTELPFAGSAAAG